MCIISQEATAKKLKTDQASYQTNPLKQQKVFRRFIRYGIIVTPLLASFSLVPVLMISSTFIGQIDAVEDFFTTNKIIKAASFVGSLVFILWTLNLFLLRFFYSKKWNRQWLMYFISYLTVLALVFALSTIIEHQKPPFAKSAYFPFIAASINNSIVWIFLISLFNREHRSNLESEKAQLELTTLVSKHEMLKRQIQPHFLFNCLSNLQALIISNDKREAEKYTVLLSKFLRASLEMGQENLVSLQQELEFLSMFEKLQKIRFGESLIIINTISEDISKSYLIPVFSLQILVENAIKHNSLNDEKPLIVELTFTPSTSEIHVKNNINTRLQDTKGTGIGLANLIERTELLTSQSPQIFNQDNSFNVSIKLISNENSNN